MVVGILQAELRIDWAESLKDKRRVVRSLRDRLHREHLVSFAEVAAHDILNVAVIGVAVVSEHGANAGDVLDRVERKIRSLHDAEAVAVRREIIQGRELVVGDEPPATEADDLAAEMLAQMTSPDASEGSEA